MNMYTVTLYGDELFQVADVANHFSDLLQTEHCKPQVHQALPLASTGSETRMRRQFRLDKSRFLLLSAQTVSYRNHKGRLEARANSDLTELQSRGVTLLAVKA
jgi:hypothetical protein